MLQPLEGSALAGLCWTPDTPAAPGGWPLLVFLHGYDEAAPLPPEHALTRHGPLNPANPSWILETFAIVAPQLPEAGDHWLHYADDVLAIQAQFQRDHACDARRCYLSGFSYGGNGVFDIAAASPDRWQRAGRSIRPACHTTRSTGPSGCRSDRSHAGWKCASSRR